MTMRLSGGWIGWASALLLVGCGSDGSGGHADCSDGKVVMDGAACVFEGPITETGFDCPPNMPYEFGGQPGDEYLLCSAHDMDPEAVDQAMAEAESESEDEPREEPPPEEEAPGDNDCANDSDRDGIVDCRDFDPASGPLAASDVAHTEAGVAVIIDLIANDHSTGSPLHLDHVSPAQFGTVEIASPTTVRYTPQHTTGSDHFTYTACDLDGLCTSADVNVIVGAPGTGCHSDLDGDGTCTGMDLNDEDATIIGAGTHEVDGVLYLVNCADGMCFGIDICLIDASITSDADDAPWILERQTRCAADQRGTVWLDSQIQAGAEVCDGTTCFTVLEPCLDASGQVTECGDGSEVPDCRDDDRDGICDP